MIGVVTLLRGGVEGKFSVKEKSLARIIWVNYGVVETYIVASLKLKFLFFCFRKSCCSLLDFFFGVDCHELVTNGPNLRRATLVLLQLFASFWTLAKSSSE